MRIQEWEVFKINRSGANSPSLTMVNENGSVGLSHIYVGWVQKQGGIYTMMKQGFETLCQLTLSW